MQDYTVKLTPDIVNLASEGSLDTSLVNGVSIQRTLNSVMVVDDYGNRKITGNLHDGDVFNDTIDGINMATLSTWTVVTGGAAGNGRATEVSQNYWNIVGPDDNNQDGWCYIKASVLSGGYVDFSLNWNTPDSGGCCDWTVISVDGNNPTGKPSDVSRVNTSTPFVGSVRRFVKAGDYISVGIYSNDSEAGPGYLGVGINGAVLVTPTPTPTMSPTPTATMVPPTPTPTVP